MPKIRTGRSLASLATPLPLDSVFEIGRLEPSLSPDHVLDGIEARPAKNYRFAALRRLGPLTCRIESLPATKPVALSGNPSTREHPPAQHGFSLSPRFPRPPLPRSAHLPSRGLVPPRAYRSEKVPGSRLASQRANRSRSRRAWSRHAGHRFTRPAGSITPQNSRCPVLGLIRRPGHGFGHGVGVANSLSASRSTSRM